MSNTASFGVSNAWIIPNSEWRTWFKITVDGVDYSYTTYVDFDTLTWKETFWDGPTSRIAETTWKLTETSWAKFDPAYEPPALRNELPDLFNTNAAKLDHEYQFAQGENTVTTAA